MFSDVSMKDLDCSKESSSYLARITMCVSICLGPDLCYGLFIVSTGEFIGDSFLMFCSCKVFCFA